MTTQSRMQQIDTLANYPMGTKTDSFRLLKKTFKSGEPMKTSNPQVIPNGSFKGLKSA